VVVHFGYNKGYCSVSTIREIAERIEEQILNGKEVILLYLGDHDPSGLDMIRDIEARIREFLEVWFSTKGVMTRMEAQYFIDEHFNIEHVALKKEQIDKYDLPANPAKFSDPRAKDYIAEYGEISWELDALEPEVLMQLTEDAILQYLDVDKYTRWVKQESKESKKLFDFGESLKKKDEKKDEA